MTPQTLVKIMIVICLLSLAAGGIALAQSGGSFKLRQHTVDGGGGVSSGGAFEVSGTAGQVDAGTSSGGAFTLYGGFWHPEEAQRIYLPMVTR
jgi:hypothetical protein